MAEWRVAGGYLRTKLVQPGDVHITTEGTPLWYRCLGPAEMITVAFSSDFLAKVAGDPMLHRRIELKSLFHIQDEHIRALGSMLEMEARAGCPTGLMYGESLGTALAAYLIRNYAVVPPKIVEYTGGLSRHRLRQVVDHIKSNLAEDNGLQELAKLAQMNLFHFCRSFKQSTGLPPHQYVLQLRIEEAKYLLRNTKLGIAEIGNRVGFSDQSHFTIMFRKFVGTTPARWRAST